MPTLEVCYQRCVLSEAIENSRDDEAKQKEDSEPPREVFSTHASFTSPPFLYLLLRSLIILLTLCALGHVAHLGRFPLWAQCRDGDHLDRTDTAGPIIVFACAMRYGLIARIRVVLA